MSKSGSAAKIKLNSFDDLFGSTEEKDDNAERIVRVKLTDLYEEGYACAKKMFEEKRILQK